uniref:Putative capsid protein n=1 Tax=uncultured virus TaxID=340016 RepID=A0A2H4YQ26_9VIRU|nr:putative capsid protein [uncultured virus]
MRYRITFTNIETDKQLEVAITVRPNNTTDNVMESIREAPSCVYKAILGTEASGQNNKISSGYASVAKARGVSKARVNIDSDFQALVTANPALVPILSIYMINQDTATSAQMRVRVDFLYYAEFSDRKLQLQS